MSIQCENLNISQFAQETIKRATQELDIDQQFTVRINHCPELTGDGWFDDIGSLIVVYNNFDEINYMALFESIRHELYHYYEHLTGKECNENAAENFAETAFPKWL